MATVLQSYMGKSFDACLDELSGRALMPVKPGPLPPMFQVIRAAGIIDVAESLATVSKDAGASIVEEAKAANGVAMRVPKAKGAELGRPGHDQKLWRFGRVRHIPHICGGALRERLSETGPAFVGGVWDSRKQKMLGGASFPLGPRTPAPASARGQTRSYVKRDPQRRASCGW